ncbi:WD repeat-containing protein 75 [Clupea harengus]|uniref:WD repeat-containing protein 75 n=1 Tax=Clupea harengus TaxID=7950 RepID=A0A6P3WG63_CLUHA|nr:WD repeat-containing protein 75 [Clupea harengus]
MVEGSEIRVVRCGGSKINTRPPIITVDSRFLLCVSGDLVKVYSTKTEELVRVLEGHTNQVTGIALNPANHLQVYSCSADGTIMLWDFMDGILIKTFVVSYPILSMYVSQKHQGVIFAVLPMANAINSDSFQVVAVHLPKVVEAEVDAPELSAVLTNVSSNPRCTAFGREGEYLVSGKGLQLSIFFFRKQKTYRVFLKASDKKGTKNGFSCVACHPKEDCIATGHEDGKIRLWRNFDHKKEYTYTTIHWHHNIVNTLCFTPEGTNLLSGGIESVLVQWQYGDTKKAMLPRLGGAITHISVSRDGALYCTCHSDNKITLIQSSIKVCGNIQGLVKGDAVRTDLLVDPRSKALVLNGKPGHLQFYNLKRDRQLYNLDIVQQEYIYEEGLDQYEVAMAAFSSQGSWLATVEERGRKLSDLEFSLKLWAFDRKTQSFSLNTTVAAAHNGQIGSMCFCPSSKTTVLVTTSKDGHFKAWLLGGDVDAEKADEGGEGDGNWSCDFVGSYHGLQPTRGSFSADGSLLAVSFSEVITLWSPDTWELLSTLCLPPGDVRDLCFGSQSCSKYLLSTTTRNMLCCWNLLTCSLEWSTSMDVVLLKLDPLSDNVAAFTKQDGNTDLFVFKPSEPRPLFTKKAVCVGDVSRAIFVPRTEPLDSCEESAQWLNRSQLYILTENMDLLTLCTKTEEDKMAALSKQLVVDKSVAVTPFYLLLGQHRRQQQEKQDDSVHGGLVQRTALPQGSVAIKELLHTPAHVLPSASFLCSMFVSSLLISTADNSRESVPQEEEMDSEKEEEDSEGEPEPESRDGQPDPGGASGSVVESVPRLSKAQERDLRRVRKTDYSWLSSLVEA